MYALNRVLQLSGWKKLNSIELTPAGKKWAEKKGVFRYTQDFVEAYYKGEPDSTNYWIIITDDAGFYKHGAEYMIWSNTYVLAVWSTNFCVKILNSIMLGQKPPRDPDYQT